MVVGAVLEVVDVDVDDDEVDGDVVVELFDPGTLVLGAIARLAVGPLAVGGTVGRSDVDD